MPDYAYIGNAGLVVLAPFLTTLFTKLGFIRNSHFLTQEHQFRAIYLLQYAVYGENIPSGESVLLNCLLTNTDPTFPLPEYIPVPASEKEIVTSLLNS
ncbi:MAG: hypothetical protein LIP01_14340, partial [Tannerellaceae bacterium]|nr:hypothetical protein [Tannerellaceae bacterium]